MNDKNDTIGKIIKREAVRAIFERQQSMDIRRMLGMEKEEVRYDDVEDILNIPYINRGETPLAMDIFKPIVPEETALPVIVTIHGGGLTMGDRSLSRPFGRLIAHKGYLVFSLEYRLAPRANVCQQLDDVCAGLDVVTRKFGEFNVDHTRVFLAAESAGAFLAFYVTAMKKSEKLQEAIGYTPGNMTFQAIGLNSGMFYTTMNNPGGWILADQIFGDKRVDEDFLEYMNPEHPEIINNLPPIFLFTSQGDFMNNYSLKLDEALKKSGRPSRLLYCGDEELQHAFMTTQTDHPKTVEAIDKMLAWFEEQAQQAKNDTDEAEIQKQENLRKDITEGMADGRMDDQRIWHYLKERASIDKNRKFAPAIMDCTQTYTYGQMFEQWDQYAKVFSALNMTGANSSRVAIAGTISAEPLFSFYALNMTGAEVSMFSYPDFLPGGKWKTMIEKEKITDLVISDIMVTPQLWHEIKKEKDKLGLKNVILLHSLLGGPCTGPAELTFNEFNYHALKRIPGTVFMDDLLLKYKDGEIIYGENSGDALAIITHTSGTTKGTRKPLPYTNRAVNSVCSKSPDGLWGIDPEYRSGRNRVALAFDFSSFLNVCGFSNLSLASGYTVVLTFFGCMHPKFIRAINYYNLDVVFTAGFVMDKWLERTDIDDIDFSNLKVLSCGGSYLPVDKLKKYKKFAAQHGYTGDFARGYGMSETGGAELVVPKDCERDILGYPTPKERFRIQDETDGKFYTADDGVRTGIMYIASDSLCCNELDGEELFEFTEMDGMKFICSNDLVRVNEDGSFSYVGRANRFFTNNEGVEFEAGIVETLLMSHQNIKQCAIVPVLDKRIHDTVPVLYVIPDKNDLYGAERVRQAVKDVYLNNKRLEGSILPSQFIIVDQIPCNVNGKIDIFQITRSRLQGIAYDIIPIKKNDCLSDVAIRKNMQVNSMFAGSLPQGMGTDSAFNLFDLFNDTIHIPMPSLKDAKLRMPKIDPPAFTLVSTNNGRVEIPKDFIRKAMKVQGLLYGQVNINHDFES